MTMRDVSIRIVDAFTTTPFAGNPAGVVLEAEGLPDAAMQAIARKVNASETALLLGTQRSDADLRVRWFTPATEIDLCGHATVATFHTAMEQGRLAAGTFRMECRAGVLPVSLEKGGDGRPEVSLGLPVPEMVDAQEIPAAVAAALGIGARDLDRSAPLTCSGEWLVIPVAGLEVLRRMRPDFGAIRAAGERSGSGCWIALTQETVDPGSAVHIRMFAPGFGIDEDPVTGWAQGAVASWLVRRGLLRADAGSASTCLYTAEQGDIIGRRGRIRVTVTLDGEDKSGAPGISAITITGSAVTVMRGALTLVV